MIADDYHKREKKKKKVKDTTEGSEDKQHKKHSDKTSKSKVEALPESSELTPKKSKENVTNDNNGKAKSPKRVRWMDEVEAEIARVKEDKTEIKNPKVSSEASKETSEKKHKKSKHQKKEGDKELKEKEKEASGENPTSTSEPKANDVPSTNENKDEKDQPNGQESSTPEKKTKKKKDKKVNENSEASKKDEVKEEAKTEDVPDASKEQKKEKKHKKKGSKVSTEDGKTQSAEEKSDETPKSETDVSKVDSKDEKAVEEAISSNKDSVESKATATDGVTLHQDSSVTDGNTTTQESDTLQKEKADGVQTNEVKKSQSGDAETTEPNKAEEVVKKEAKNESGDAETSTESEGHKEEAVKKEKKQKKEKKDKKEKHRKRQEEAQASASTATPQEAKETIAASKDTTQELKDNAAASKDTIATSQEVKVEDVAPIQSDQSLTLESALETAVEAETRKIPPQPSIERTLSNRAFDPTVPPQFMDTLNKEATKKEKKHKKKKEDESSSENSNESSVEQQQKSNGDNESVESASDTESKKSDEDEETGEDILSAESPAQVQEWWKRESEELKELQKLVEEQINISSSLFFAPETTLRFGLIQVEDNLKKLYVALNEGKVKEVLNFVVQIAQHTSRQIQTSVYIADSSADPQMKDNINEAVDKLKACTQQLVQLTKLMVEDNSQDRYAELRQIIGQTRRFHVRLLQTAKVIKPPSLPSLSTRNVKALRVTSSSVTNTDSAVAVADSKANDEKKEKEKKKSPSVISRAANRVKRLSLTITDRAAIMDQKNKLDSGVGKKQPSAVTKSVSESTTSKPKVREVEVYDPTVPPSMQQQDNQPTPSQNQPTVTTLDEFDNILTELTLGMDTCYQCQLLLLEDEVKAGQTVKALGRSWHRGCLSCKTCGMKFTDPKIEFKEGEDGWVYCTPHFEERFPPCATCKERVGAAAVTALGNMYHIGCFVCATCRQPFPNNQFYNYRNTPYCESHYYHCFGMMCVECSKPLYSGKCVNAGGLRFHEAHFVCNHCKISLHGRAFDTHSGKAFCHKCYLTFYG